ncbi:CapA family protein [Candidatus Parcubacteria bacterium]|nr:MAG: CapA family protein [Candidatus Parcubacteria bacterium]
MPRSTHSPRSASSTSPARSKQYAAFGAVALIGAAVAAAWWLGVPDTAEYEARLPRAPVPAAEPTRDSATLLFVGDIMLDRGIDAIMRRRDDWIFPFRRMQPLLREADLLIGNLEGPISDQGTNVGSIYSFRADPRAIEGLVAAGFDILSVANNHIWDYGPDAARDTLTRLGQAGIAPVGGGVDVAEAHAPVMRTINGVRIALLAYTDLLPESRGAADASPAIAYLDPAIVRADIAAARQNADVVIVMLHWGNEYEPHPTAAQRALARVLIAEGATLVIGHHPHVVQDIERVGEGLIAYSLGNFVFDQNFSPETSRAIALRVMLDRGGLAGWQALPIRFTAAFEPYPATTTP